MKKETVGANFVRPNSPNKNIGTRSNRSMEKGITLVTLTVYIISLLFALAILAIVTTYFRSNLNDMKDGALDVAEYDKFNLHFLDEVKRTDNEIKEPEYNASVSSISFASGNRYEYVNGEEAVYRINGEENIKIAERVKECSFNVIRENEKNVVTVNIRIGNDEESRITKYVMGVGTQTGNYADEGNYITEAQPTVELTKAANIPQASVGGSIASVTNEGVPVPQGFYYVGGTRSTGVVISDSSADLNKGDAHNTNLSGNQFVWVPCGNVRITVAITHNNSEEVIRKWAEGSQTASYFETNGNTFTGNSFDVAKNGIYTVYAKSNNGKETIKEIEVTESIYGKWNASNLISGQHVVYESLIDGAMPTKVSGTWGQNEYSQIVKYGGFYIARYEAGTTITTNTEAARNVAGTPIIKSNQIPWTNISRERAKLNSETIYSASNFVQGGLITGTEWDALCKWLENSGKNIQTDSKSNGNYLNSNITGVTSYSSDDGNTWTTVANGTKGVNTHWLLKTGNTSYTKMNNIYDISGNVLEYVTEAQANTGTAVLRGGCWRSDDTEYQTTCRYWETYYSGGDNYYGFRVALYIK